jgi:twitching motility protein PilJ
MKFWFKEKNKNAVVSSKWGYTTIATYKNTTSKFNRSVGLAIAAIGIVITLVSAGFYLQKEGDLSTQVSVGQELIGLTQSVAKNALKASQGDKAALTALEENGTRFNKKLEIMKSLKSEEASDAFLKMEQDWKTIGVSIKSIVAAKVELGTLQAKLAQAEKDLFQTSKAMNGLQQVSKDMGLQERESIGLAKDRIQQVLTNVVGLQGRPEVSHEVSFQVTKDLAAFASFLKNAEQGNKAEDLSPLSGEGVKAALQRVKTAFEGAAQANLLSLANDMDEVQNAKELGGHIFKMSDVLLKDANELAANVQSSKSGQTIWLLVGVLGLVLVGLGGFYTVLVRGRDDTRAAKEATAKNAREESAANKMVHEIKDVGTGDLSVQATADEGTLVEQVAIAFNANVNELRGLVGRVRQTSNEVGDMVAETTGTAKRLEDMADAQEKTVDKVSKAMGDMSQKLDGVAQETSISADLASKAVQMSKRGEGVVNNTIQGMTAIRENIQETSKRIKDLGESSQQIGEVTQLIRDIGSKIQVLALNASIQAAGAGEAGKGFAVVAEEVQQLAEESANSVQRIDKLVLKIQTAAKETISNMEQTTQKVVEGAKTADNAGNALKEIGLAAASLQATVQKVTERMQQGTEEITDLTLEIGQIKSMAKRTKEGVSSASKSMQKMGEASATLQESVSKFRLEK